MANIENQHFDEEPPFSEKEKSLYQAAYKQLQDEIDVSFYDPKKSFAEIERKLGLNAEIKKRVKKSWLGKISEYCSVHLGISVTTQATSAAASVFAIGIILGLYVNTGPAYKSSSSGTGIDILRGKQGFDKEQIFTLIKSDPIEFINLVVDSGLDAGVEIKIAKTDASYILVISGLKANNESQAGFKAILGLTSSQTRDVLIEVIEGNRR